MLSEQVKLSLATFQPEKCYPPYLNTPRSLEACRMNGVNPVELVIIPYSEFQKDFPNDPDATQRRYERIEGARVRMLEYVRKDWKKLCDSGWVAADKKPPASKEAILQVAPQSHCQLLELQAAKFRKIEQDNWDALQRSLKIQILKADQEVRGHKIIEKQDNIQAENDRIKRERKERLEEMEREHIREMAEKEEQRQREIREEQERYAAEEKRKHEQRVRDKQQERAATERKEEERVRRENYTQQLKDSIMNRIENRVESRKKAAEIKQQQNEQRLNQFFNAKLKERQSKRNEVDQKLEAVKEERIRREERMRQEMLATIQENERKRKQVEEERERLRQQMLKAADNDSFEKMNKIRESTEAAVREKAERTLHQLQYKNDLARQELEKVQEAQERRKRIKAIRREAFEIAKFRAAKAEEYRKQRLEQEIKDKEERSAAIKRGFHILEHMRNSMKDIMVKTNLELKEEFHRLRHRDEFEPDKVVTKAMEVSNHVLFPSLQRTFGIQDLAEEDALRQQQNKRFFMTGSDGDEEGGGFAFNTTNKSADNDPLMQTSQSMPLFEGDKTMPRAQSAGTGQRPVKERKGREEVATLPIQKLTQDRLKQTLLESMKRVEHLHELSEEQRRSQARARSKRQQRMGHHQFGQEDYEDDDLDYDGSPEPILQANQVDHPSNHPDAAMFSDNISLTSSQQRQRHHDQQTRLIDGQASSQRITNAASSVTLASVSPTQHSSSPHRHNKTSTSRTMTRGGANQKQHRSQSPPSRSQSPQHDHSNVRDVQLPVYAFTAGKEFDDMQRAKEAEAAAADQKSGQKRRPMSAQNRSLTSSERRIENLRTDKNDKAKYMPTPQGKFRREFSLDHPYAPKGLGKYKKELKKGLKPVQFDASKSMTSDVQASADVAQTLAMAQKVEKLTYDAETSVVDSEDTVKQLQEASAKKLQDLIEEERLAEEDRVEAIRNVVDAQEKAAMDQIFAEERSRASERIITATKEHDALVRNALLRTMNLGNK